MMTQAFVFSYNRESTRYLTDLDKHQGPTVCFKSIFTEFLPRLTTIILGNQFDLNCSSAFGAMLEKEEAKDDDVDKTFYSFSSTMQQTHQIIDMTCLILLLTFPPTQEKGKKIKAHILSTLLQIILSVTINVFLKRISRQTWASNLVNIFFPSNLLFWGS